MASIFRQLLKLSVTLEILVSDCVNFCAAGLRSRTALAAENLFLRKQLALFQEREKKSRPNESCRSVRLVQARPLLRLAQRLADCQTSHLNRLASSCLPPLLAFEIETSRPAIDIGRGAALNSSNGDRKSDLGRRADCRRTLAQTADSSLTTYG